MNIVIDVNYLVTTAFRNPLSAFWFFFKYGGWIVFLLVIIWGLWKMWILWRQNKYGQTLSYVLLAIDVPKNSEQTPKAVEHIFSQLAGALSGANLIEKYWHGKVQKSFSLEIASIDGYIQFFIWTEVKLRDLVEAAVYAQYPDAEITEVSDYADSVPRSYPDDNYELWGTEYILARENSYPIRTYPSFEHPLTQTFTDPMAALLEILSKLKKGEQVWIQLIVAPVKDDWKEQGEKLYKELIGAKTKSKKTLFDRTLDVPVSLLERTGDIFFTEGGTGVSEKKTEEAPSEPSQIQYLSPGEKNTVEAIQSKISKIGFKTKIRIIYTAPKEIFDKSRGVAPVDGAIKQFNTLDLNAFKADKRIKTKIDYFFKERRENVRKNKIIENYVGRSGAGSPPFILNIEELATIYHFPTIAVKAPLIRKAESKRAEPPMTLPLEEAEEAPGIKTKEEPKKPEPPANLPFED